MTILEAGMPEPGTKAFTPPPGLEADDRVVLFDGVCRLCSGWAGFLLRHDRRRRYKLATVQSPAGQALLAWCDLPLDDYRTLVLVSRDGFYTRSAAIVRVLAGLPLPWKLGAAAWLLPRPVRDWLYDRLARNRYRWFGRRDTCMVPTASQQSRFLAPSNARD